MKLVEVYLVGAQLVQQDVSPLVARCHVGLVVAEGHARHGVRPVAPAAHQQKKTVVVNHMDESAGRVPVSIGKAPRAEI